MKKCRPMKAVALLLVWACVFTLLAGCSTPAAPTVPTGTNPTEPSETDPTVDDNTIEFVAKPFAVCGINWDIDDVPPVMRDLQVVISGDRIILTTLYENKQGKPRQYTVSQRSDLAVSQIHSVDHIYCYYDKEETRAILERVTGTEEFTYIITGNSSVDLWTVMLMYHIDGTYYIMEMIGGTAIIPKCIWVGKPTE